MGWLKHFLDSFKAKPIEEDGLVIDCCYRLRYNDGLILCRVCGVRSIESCKTCEFKNKLDVSL